MNFGKGKTGVHGPDGLADFVQETLRAGAGGAKDVGDVAHGHGVIALEVIHHEWPIDGGGGGFAYAVVVNVADDADDFSPVVFGADANALAESRRGIGPILASYVFRNHSDRDFLVGVVPGDLAAGNQWRAESAKISGRDELKAAERRKLAFGVGAVLKEDRIGPALAGHGDF